MHGHDTANETTTLLVMAAMCGKTTEADIIRGLAKDDAILKVVQENMMKAPLLVIMNMQRSAAAHLIRHGAQRSMVRAVPLVGGLVGGAVDAAMLVNTGINANKLFESIAPQEASA